MAALILKAHYDGKHIVLDEPFELAANAPLAVTVLPPDAERAEWTGLATQPLANAYGELEPEYSLADLKTKS